MVSLSLMVVCVLIASPYARGWLALRSDSPNVVQTWRAWSGLLGLTLVWVAIASPLASFHAELLTVHIVQDVLIVTVAAPLILLAAPGRPLLLGLPSSWVHTWIRPGVCGAVQWLGRILGRRLVCWFAATAALVGWHTPAAVTFAMHSGTWRGCELASVLATALLFWWPVVRSLRSPAPSSGWGIVLYLWLATLPCDVLSACLVFSDRVVYTVYLTNSGHAGLSALDDQQLAGALMGTIVTIVYLAAATALSRRWLPRQGRAWAPFVSNRVGTA